MTFTPASTRLTVELARATSFILIDSVALISGLFSLSLYVSLTKMVASLSVKPSLQ